MPTLYHFMDCPYCFKLRVYLAERDIAWHSAVVARGQMPPELPSLNPLRRLPVWVTDEHKPIFGTNTIISYLEEVHPDRRLLPEDPLRRARCWMADELVIEGVLEPLIKLDRDMGGREPSEWSLSTYKRQTARVEKMLAIFEQLLGGRAWLVGDSMTVADISLALPLTILERFGLDLAALPALGDLGRRLAELPSVVQARKKPDSSLAE